MKQSQQGFTLIELIAVMVILGILAATAVPRFINLQAAAEQAAVDAIAGAIESSSSLNFAADLAENAGLSPAGTGGAQDPVTTAGATCAAATQLLMEPDIDTTKFTLAATVVGGDGVATSCTVTTVANGLTASHNIIGATDDP